VITAIDTSVMIQLLRRQPGWEQWKSALTKASAEGILVMCPVVFAECSMGFSSSEQALANFETLHIRYDDMLPKSAFLAGSTFLQYRQQGGPRRQMIPDFLIAAHASEQADRLAAMDRGYHRKFFPTLTLLEPSGAGEFLT
jgi:hypothetical protein